MSLSYSNNHDVYVNRGLIEVAAKLARRGWKTKEECKFWHNDLADGDGWIMLSCARAPRIAVYAFSTGEYRDKENELSIVAIKDYEGYGVDCHKYGEFLTSIKPMLEYATRHDGTSFDFVLFLRETILAIALLIAYICEPGWNWDLFLRRDITDWAEARQCPPHIFPEILLAPYSIANTIYAIEKEAGFADYYEFSFNLSENFDHDICALFSPRVNMNKVNMIPESIWTYNHRRHDIIRQIICNYEALKTNWNKGAQR